MTVSIHALTPNRFKVNWGSSLSEHEDVDSLPKAIEVARAHATDESVSVILSSTHEYPTLFYPKSKWSAPSIARDCVKLNVFRTLRRQGFVVLSMAEDGPVIQDIASTYEQLYVPSNPKDDSVTSEARWILSMCADTKSKVVDTLPEDVEGTLVIIDDCRNHDGGFQLLVDLRSKGYRVLALDKGGKDYGWQLLETIYG